MHYIVTHASRGKPKYIVRFEIMYFFLELGLSPKGLTQAQEKVYNFKPHYILWLSTGLRAQLYSACAMWLGYVDGLHHVVWLYAQIYVL